MAAIINNSIGYTYNFPIRIGGMVLLFLGLAITLTGWVGVIAGIFLALGGAYFAFTGTGISINMDEKAVRHYTSYGGLKTGKWVQYTTYPFICVIRKDRKRSKLLAESEMEADKPYQYEINMLSRSHRGRVLMQVEYERVEAERIAKYFAEEMNLEVVEYQNPGRAKKRNQSEESGSESKHRHHYKGDRGTTRTTPRE
jgi:hypothetical protein